MQFSTINKETRDGRKVKSLFRVIRSVNPENEPQHLILPDDIEMLEPMSLADLYNIKIIYIHDKITEIPPRCFQRSSMSFVRMSPNVQHIYDYAFWNCKNFIKTTIPEGCKLGVKSYTGDYVYAETIFDGCPKYAKNSNSAWIDSTIFKGEATIMYEGGLLQMSKDLKNWEIIPDVNGLYQYKLDGDVRTFRVVVPNEHPTPRTKDNPYLVKSRIISLKE